MRHIRYAVILVLSLLLLTACQQKQPETPQEICSYYGGEWKTFSSACADTCDYARSGGLSFCAQVLTESCDCGEDMCWNGEECEFI